MTKAFDKLERILQPSLGQNPEDFDYAFNLEYGKKYTDQNDLISALRQLVDIQTAALIK